MYVRDILKVKGQEVFTVRSDDTVIDAARSLETHNIGAAPVVDKSGRLVGMMSERDIVRVLGKWGQETFDQPVSRYMTTPVFTIDVDESVHEVMQMMTRRRFRHLPVVHDGRLVGIVTIGDVLKHRLDEMRVETNVLRDQIMMARSRSSLH